ncbi:MULTISPECIES: hypothetical protein [Spirulina sp. CCY15215]|uniref:hypothetical protein n=1 Tax=Spirulina sp. CCY15215 TaxID=2767591 RepID=UPI00194DC2DF|nr:hypothetical protein [Spirulina major]
MTITFYFSQSLQKHRRLLPTLRKNWRSRSLDSPCYNDPRQEQITVLSLVAGLYEETVFSGEMAIASPLLLELGQESPLTATQILQLG